MPFTNTLFQSRTWGSQAVPPVSMQTWKCQTMAALEVHSVRGGNPAPILGLWSSNEGIAGLPSRTSAKGYGFPIGSFVWLPSCSSLSTLRNPPYFQPWRQGGGSFRKPPFLSTWVGARLRLNSRWMEGPPVSLRMFGGNSEMVYQLPRFQYAWSRFPSLKEGSLL